MRRRRLGSAGLGAVAALVVGLTGCGEAPSSSAAASGPAPAAGPLPGRSAPVVHVVSRNARGGARVLLAALAREPGPLALLPDAAARLHLSQQAALLGLREGTIRDAALAGVQPLAGGGGVYTFSQRVNGLEVFGARASVVLDGSHRLVSLASDLGSFEEAERSDAIAFARPPTAAVAQAYGLLARASLDSNWVRDAGARGRGLREYTVATPAGGTRVLRAAAKPMFCPERGRLVAAYYVELLGRDAGSKSNRGMSYLIDAQDGHVLRSASLTRNEAFEFRVWADPSGAHTPSDGPLVDSTPLPGGAPGLPHPEFARPILVSMAGFNTNPQGGADPWLLPTDTFTFGNNVQAYSDRNEGSDGKGKPVKDGYDEGDIRADATSAHTFDRTYDPSQPPNVDQDQIKAAITQSFYLANWQHDYWYDSGFDEQAGNAQLSNYGRGGIEGDPLQMEVQNAADDGLLDTANTSFLSDGLSPVIQLFVWSGQPLRDASLDNTVVAHEWGHYMYGRLVSCATTQCSGLHEGWADFIAQMMIVRDGDRFDGGEVYPHAQYANSGRTSYDYSYFGSRRAPYSTDLAKNPFTFASVREAATAPQGVRFHETDGGPNESHNVGEIWTSALFEGYVNLLALGRSAQRPFEESKRRMADYVVAGMKSTLDDPTFVEQRDAVLMAALASGHTEDFTALAQGFAKRGLGQRAVAPPVSSDSLNEMIENFEAKGELTFIDAVVDDSVQSCDHDGHVDASEAGKLTLRLSNTGWSPLTKTRIKVSTTDPNVTFDAGGEGGLDVLEPYRVASLEFGIFASAETRRGAIPITVELSDPDALERTAASTVSLIFNVDEEHVDSDDFESDRQTWTQTRLPALQVPPGRPVWGRKADETTHVFHGDDVDVVSDGALMSPSLAVGMTSAFTMAFSHRYAFEENSDHGSFFDGGVIELSTDDGVTWQDISTYAEPLYPSILNLPDPSSPVNNPLAGSPAFGGKSLGYPAMIDASLDLGMQLAGKLVRVRFRIGTDNDGGGLGWDIDDVAFGGITNAPFSSYVDDAASCGGGGPPGAEGSSAGAGGAAADEAGSVGETAGAGSSRSPSSSGAAGAGSENGNGQQSHGCSCSAIGRSDGQKSAGLALLALVACLARPRRRGVSARLRHVEPSGVGAVTAHAR